MTWVYKRVWTRKTPRPRPPSPPSRPCRKSAAPRARIRVPSRPVSEIGSKMAVAPIFRPSLFNRLRELLLLASLPLILLATLYLSVALFWLVTIVIAGLFHIKGALVLPAIYTIAPTRFWDNLHLTPPVNLPPGTVRLLPLGAEGGFTLPPGMLAFVHEAGMRAITSSWHWVLVIALVWLVLGYRYQQKWGLVAADLNRLQPGSAPELEEDLAGLAHIAGLKTPSLSVWQNDAPNAFASGLGPQTYMVTVTTGLLQRL